MPIILWGWLLMLSFSGGEELRTLSTDRPDTTESPHTVDAGHFQMEWEISAWEKDGSARQLTLGELNAKVGLSDWADLQVILPFYQSAEWEASYNTGATRQLDGGVRLGLTGASTDVTPFLGISTKY